MGYNDKYKIVKLQNLDDYSVDCPNCINEDSYGKVTEIKHKGVTFPTTNHYVCFTCGCHLELNYKNFLPPETAIIKNHYGTKTIEPDSIKW